MIEKADKPQGAKKKGFSFDPSKLRPPQTYTVKAGDTLSKIAKKFYGDDAAYMDIYKANKGLIGASPDNIKVGMELKIPPKK
ncbi:MAG: LysM domain-containing protein [Anaerolineales bacterium]|nr:MAG: LysM domain-containing protein [Anaerolineales bacterium]